MFSQHNFSCSYSWDLARATRLARLFEQHHPDKKITLIGRRLLSSSLWWQSLIITHHHHHQPAMHASAIPISVAVPTNNGWEKVKRDFSQVFASLTSLQTPDYVSFSENKSQRARQVNETWNILLQPKSIMLRHVIVASRAFTIEQLVEKSLRSPLRTVKTEVDMETVNGKIYQLNVSVPVLKVNCHICNSFLGRWSDLHGSWRDYVWRVQRVVCVVGAWLQDQGLFVSLLHN